MIQFLKAVTTEKESSYGWFGDQEDIFGFGFSCLSKIHKVSIVLGILENIHADKFN